MMFKNYLAVAQRNLKKNLWYALINIAGLAIGLACSLVIILYVMNQLEYDRFHKDVERIHRVTTRMTMANNVLDFAIIMGPVGPAMKADYPEIETMVRMFKIPRSFFLARGEKKYFEKNLVYADPDFFKLFSFELLRGNPETALQKSYSLVITDEMAKKYFGEEDPIGKIITQNNKQDYIVTGVVKKPRAGSHIKFDFINSFSSMEERHVEQWRLVRFYTYLKLRPGVDPEALEARFPAFIAKYLGTDLEEIGVKNWELFLQPMTDIHLYSHLDEEFEPNTHISTIVIFITIALFILVIACINFMLLSVAASSHRGREVGIRKLLGAGRKSLARQFLGASMLLTFISLLIGLFLVYAFFMDIFSSVTGQPVAFQGGTGWLYILGFIALACLVGVGGGAYPAFVLANLRPVRVLRGELKSGAGGNRVKQVLIALQYCISIGIIACTFVIYSQNDYLNNRDLGFQKENVLVVPFKSLKTVEKYPSMKTELLKNPNVISVTSQLSFLGDFIEETVVQPEGMEESVPMNTLWSDYGFIDTMGIKLVRGRDFSPEYATDMNNAVLINETAARTFGWDDPLGKTIVHFNGRGEEQFRQKVVGVVEDFHFESLHKKVKPMKIFLNSWRWRVLLVRLAPGRTAETLGYVREVWDRFEKDLMMDYFFLEDSLERLYKNEERLGRIFVYFALLSIFIACLGLFGIASITARQRSREIGIRKIHGASEGSVIWLILKDFSRLVAIAAVVAAPVAYYAMGRWLQNFAYHVQLTVFPFILAGLAALLIAGLTVSYQAVKASRTVPVEVLRCE